MPIGVGSALDEVKERMVSNVERRQLGLSSVGSSPTRRLEGKADECRTRGTLA